MAQVIANAYHLDNCPLLVQAIVKGDKVRVLEYSARLGGGSKYKTMQNVTDYNVLRACAMSMLGKNPGVPVIRHKDKCFSKCHLYVTGGQLCEIQGLDSLISEGTIDEFLPTTPMGVHIDSPSSSGNRIGNVFITADNYIELQRKVEKAISTIKVINEKGEDMLLRDMYLNQPPYKKV